MTIRFSHTPPNFAIAFMLAPLAGGFAAFGTAVLWSLVVFGSQGQVLAAFLAALLVGLYAAIISLVYTAVVGGIVAFSVGRYGAVPSKGLAITIALAVGFLPFFALSFLINEPFNSFQHVTASKVASYALLPTVALVASVATAWAFWSLGLKGRLDRPPNSPLHRT
jgi:hypothetical protein